MAERHIVGAAVAVIRHGKIEKIGAYGKASLEFGIPVRTSTPFSVASISKSFTGVAIMMLVEAQKVRLDDPIGARLPDLPQAWRNVTIRQLLNHTSGLPDLAVDDYTTNMMAQTPEEALRLLADKPLDFAPGASYRYNQTNYMLIGMLVKTLSGQSFEEFCAERLFKPVKASTAVFGDARVIVKERATTYTPFRYSGGRALPMDHAEVLNAEMPALAYPAGGLNVSIADFANWLAALLQGRLIRQESLDALWTPAQLDDGSVYQRASSPSLWREYGLGWVLGRDGPHPFVGGTGGIRTAFFVYPRDELAVIVLTNTQGTRPESLVDGVARRYLITAD